MTLTGTRSVGNPVPVPVPVPERLSVTMYAVAGEESSGAGEESSGAVVKTHCFHRRDCFLTPRCVAPRMGGLLVGGIGGGCMRSTGGCRFGCHGAPDSCAPASRRAAGLLGSAASPAVPCAFSSSCSTASCGFAGACAAALCPRAGCFRFRLLIPDVPEARRHQLQARDA